MSCAPWENETQVNGMSKTVLKVSVASHTQASATCCPTGPRHSTWMS
jgi:hypothetical protein